MPGPPQSEHQRRESPQLSRGVSARPSLARRVGVSAYRPRVAEFLPGCLPTLVRITAPVPLSRLANDRRQVHEVRIPAAQYRLEHGMDLLLAGVADSAGFAFNVRCVDPAIFTPVATFSTGRLNMRFGFVRRISAGQIGFVRRIARKCGFVGWDDDVCNRSDPADRSIPS
jgi:hypothetical protein